MIAPQRQIEARDQVRVYVWDLVVRACHWTIALSILVLSLTGVYLGRPFLVVTGEPGLSFVMGWAKTLHFLAAIAFTIAVLSRILWMFVGRNVYSSWREFVPSSRARLEEAVDRVLFYSLIRRDGQDSVGHNPLAGAGYSGVFGLYLFMIVSGIGLYAMSADARSWMSVFGGVVWWIGGPQLARFLHHAVMWVLLVFFVQHLYFVLLATIGERNGTMDSIFSGYKWFRRDRK